MTETKLKVIATLTMLELSSSAIRDLHPHLRIHARFITPARSPVPPKGGRRCRRGIFTRK
jgi:hypothetical protein